MKKFIFTLLLLTIALNINAIEQNDSLTKDSISFNKFLNTTTFEKYYPFKLLQRLFIYRRNFENGNKPDSAFVAVSRLINGAKITDRALDGFGTNTGIEMEGTGTLLTVPKFDDIQFPDSIKLDFVFGFNSFKRQYPRKKVAMLELIHQLEEFEKEAKHFPNFYATIEQEYKGDISAYAKDLFNKSILLDGTKYARFLRKPSSSKLASDMGVQFIIGINLYRLWLKQEAEKEKH